MSEPQFNPDVIELVIAELDTTEQTIVLLSYGAGMLPIADLSGRFDSLGMLTPGSLLNGFGQAVAREILRRDPEAHDPHGA